MADQVLQEIKDRLNVADVISGYIQVKKAGVNFKAVCPFHSEKSPSLVISPQKQIWHCFGCGEGGDVFGFVMRYENLDFKDALKLLADKAGVKLPEYKPENKAIQDEREILFKINDFAARFYNKILTSNNLGKEALKYLEGRGLKSETIKKWQIGFAPDEFHALEKALSQKKVSVQNLVKAGVSAKNERGQVYDRFRARVTFPIFDYLGKTVGFSARILPASPSLGGKDDGKSARSTVSTGAQGGESSRTTSSGQASHQPAKYVNSPETSIYQKSKILFGLNFAKNEIRKKDEAIIVEGQMDCIKAHQAGFTNVVASSGTALTEEQIVLLSRLTKNLKFCFDSDQAGLNATKRAIEMYLGKDLVVKIIDLGNFKDPDEVLSRDEKLWQKKVSEAPLFLDYYIEKSFENFQDNSVEKKKQVAKEVLPLLANLTDPLEVDHYLNLLSQKFGTSQKVLMDTLQKFKVPKSTSKFPEKAAAVSLKPLSSLLEKEILGGMLLYEDFLSEVLKESKPEDFVDYEIRSLVDIAFKSGEGFKEVGKSSSVAKEAIFMVESQLAELEGNVEALKRELLKSFFKLRLNALKQRQIALNFEIKKAESLGNKDSIKELNKQFAQILSERMKYEQ